MVSFNSFFEIVIALDFIAPSSRKNNNIEFFEKKEKSEAWLLWQKNILRFCLKIEC